LITFNINNIYKAVDVERTFNTDFLYASYTNCCQSKLSKKDRMVFVFFIHLALEVNTKLDEAEKIFKKTKDKLVGTPFFYFLFPKIKEIEEKWMHPTSICPSDNRKTNN
jgi:hypothetical protein